MKNTTTKQNFLLVISLFSATLFSGCTSDNIPDAQNTNISVDLKSIVNTVQERSAYFSLEQVEENKVLLMLHNPQKKAIQSFTSEIIFPTHLVKIQNLENLSEDIFGLHMKSDWKINEKIGKIKIASTVLGASQHTSKNMTLASFEFEKISDVNAFVLDINENISNIFVISDDKKLESVVNKRLTQDLIIN